MSTDSTAGVDVVVVPPPAGGVADDTSTAIDNDIPPIQPKPSLYRQMTKRDNFTPDNWSVCPIVAILAVVGIFIFFIVAGSLSTQNGSCSYVTKNKYGKLVTVDVALWTILQGAVPLGSAVVVPLMLCIVAATDAPEKIGLAFVTTFLGGSVSLYFTGMITQWTALTRIFHFLSYIVWIYVLFSQIVILHARQSSKLPSL
eukprot:TRINITY_DN6727_c0_g2_i2.p1 TRINITY_DN6727_c0_g2~~TRINITY_DN6727_c0_g2_i2.p1  ORF type:complete len:215 (-),score=47.18 TRINITY_DN6727_c0_g2_i2:115-714(-)